ncbi:MAG TPA: glycosyltransferase [Solirubrobacteraceae bacterium]|jgi:glycosyltransferase involved in cell wall biosynthesis|nr:glycosyltransferase [Solirubrobacteraceae bacterium]
MRILIVSQMWPGPSDPDLGSFVATVAGELEALGHTIDLAVIDRRGGSRLKYPRLCLDAVRAARRRPPDVVFAHMLFPAGLAGVAASIVGRAPLVVMAHGADVENLGGVPGVTLLTRAALRRASGLIVNSAWLGRQLDAFIPGSAARAHVIDCGVDLDLFHPADAAAARAELGWDGDDGPAFVCVGSLVARKNVVALADAFAALGRGRLAFVGDGPLRPELDGRPGVTVVGRIPHPAIARWIAAADVLCQPSLREPFGQAALEALAMERSVVVTTRGGPAEFVTPETGLLVDPDNPGALRNALVAAAGLPSPNPAGRSVAERHGAGRQAARMADVLAAAVAGHRS